MGGNAMSFETRRVESEEYFELLEEISSLLSFVVGVQKFSDIPAYRDKPNFGDIDILLVSDKPNRRDWIQEIFNPKEIVHNSNCFSFDYKNVQVDFIFVQEEEFITSKNYFSWNDLGNLIGRIAHRMGLKFGHDGLTYMIREGDYLIGEILLSKDIDAILDFLGYDPIRWHAGFNSLEDIYKYTMSSCYYSYDIFDLENRNYRAKIRDRKRPTYTGFLTYALENSSANEFPWKDEFSARTSKEFHRNSALQYFSKQEEFDVIMSKYAKNQQVKSLFNGKIVGDITFLKGKELGEFMAKFKEIFSSDDILQMTPGMIQEEIENLTRKIID